MPIDTKAFTDATVADHNLTDTEKAAYAKLFKDVSAVENDATTTDVDEKVVALDEVRQALGKERSQIAKEVRRATYETIKSEENIKLLTELRDVIIPKIADKDTYPETNKALSRYLGFLGRTELGTSDLTSEDPAFLVALVQTGLSVCCELDKELKGVDTDGNPLTGSHKSNSIDGDPLDNTITTVLTKYVADEADFNFTGVIDTNVVKMILKSLWWTDYPYDEVLDTDGDTTVTEIEEEAEKPVTKMDIEEAKVTEKIEEFTKKNWLTENADGSYTVDTQENSQKIFDIINMWKVPDTQKDKVGKIRKACENAWAKPEMMKVTKKVETKNTPKAKVETKTKLAAKEVVPAANCTEFIKNSDGRLKLSGAFATFDKTKTPPVMTKDIVGDDITDPENVTTITIGKLNFLLYRGDLMTEAWESIHYKKDDEYYPFDAGDGDGSTVFAYKTDALCISTNTPGGSFMLGKDGKPIFFKGKTEFGEIKEGTNNTNGTTDTKDDFANIIIDGVQYVPTSPYLAGLDEEAPSIDGMETTAIDMTTSQKVIDGLNTELDKLNANLSVYKTFSEGYLLASWRAQLDGLMYNGVEATDDKVPTNTLYRALEAIDFNGIDFPWLSDDQRESVMGIYNAIYDIMENKGYGILPADVNAFVSMIIATPNINTYDGDETEKDRPDYINNQALLHVIEVSIEAFIKERTDALTTQIDSKTTVLETEIAKWTSKDRTFDEMQPLGSIPDCQSIALKDARTLLITKTDGKTQEIVTMTDFTEVEKSDPVIYTMSSDDYWYASLISFSLRGTNLELRVPYDIKYEEKKLVSHSNNISNVRLLTNSAGKMTLIYDDAGTSNSSSAYGSDIVSLSQKLDDMPQKATVEKNIQKIAKDTVYDSAELFHSTQSLFGIGKIEKLKLQAMAWWSWPEAVLGYVDDTYRPAVMKKCAEMIEAKTITVDELQTSMTHYLGEIAELDTEWSALKTAQIDADGKFIDEKYEWTDSGGEFVTPADLSGDDAADAVEQERYDTEKAANGLTWFQRFVYRQECRNGIPWFKDWMKNKLTSYSAELKKLEKAPVAVEEDEEAKKEVEEEAKKKATAPTEGSKATPPAGTTPPSKGKWSSWSF